MIRLITWLIFGMSLCGGVSAVELREHCPDSMEERSGRCFLKLPFSGYGTSGLDMPVQVPHDSWSPRVVDLGRYLFFDPIMSGDGSVSCASCHQPSKSLGDGRKVSIGLHGPLARSAPTLWNVIFRKKLFWDGRARSLAEQMHGPLFSAEEMGSQRGRLLSRLSDHKNYRVLFAVAFGRGEAAVSMLEIERALVAFQASLTSFDSRYDRYARGDKEALSESELRGFNLFRSFRTRCSECHTPPLFTNDQVAILGVPDEGSADYGWGGHHQMPRMRGGFVVPSLRNVAKSAPYMHAGQFASLHEVVEFYDQGGGRGKESGKELFIHWHIRPIGLSASERADLVAFLGALDDESALPKAPEALP